MRTALIWDNHGCLPLRTDDEFLPQLSRYRDSGVNVVSINIGYAQTPWVEQVRVLSFMRQWIARHPESYHLVSNVEDIRRCKADGRLGIVFDIEGMDAVLGDLSLVQTFYELGVRWMLIAYNRNNAAGGGCLDEDHGLTEIGRNVIDEMERVGMVLCLSHAGNRTATDALEYSRKPTIFSHSNPAGDTRHARNVSDNLMRACASKGGVIGLSGIGPFLGSNANVVEHLLRQLRYVIDQVGADHVGLGLDYVFDGTELEEYVRLNPTLFPSEGVVSASMGMIEPEAVGQIVDGLVRAQLTDEQIRGILGENWLRIAQRVWR